MKPGDLVRHHKNHAWIGVVVAINVPTRIFEGIHLGHKAEVAWIGHGSGQIHPDLLEVLNESR